MRRKDKFAHSITSGFMVKISQSEHPGEEHLWIAEIKGPDVDQVTCASTPVDALFMAWDVVRLVTGWCDFEQPEHVYDIKTTIERGAYDDGEYINLPAMQCSRCGTKTVLEALEPVP